MEYSAHLITLFLILTLAALGQGLLVGQAGVVLVAAASFMGVGAYGSAFLSMRQGLAVPLAMVAAAVLCAMAGCTLGMALHRLQKDYLALASLGIGLILQDVFNNCTSVTNGPLGISGIPPAAATTSGLLSGLLLTVIVGVILLLALRRSSFGSLLRAVRDDEQLVQSIGQSTVWPRVAVFSGGFFLIGLAGAWLGHYLIFIDPSSFGLGDSIAILAMVVIGGSEHPAGALLGAGVYVFLPEALRFLGLPTEVASQVRQMLFGFLLIVLMRLRPQGLIGRYRLT